MTEETSSAASSSGSSTQPSASRRLRSIKKYFVDPRRIFHRYFLLSLICCFIPGPYYHDSQFGSYKTVVVDALALSNKEYAMLFAISSLAGVLCGPAGALVAKTGRTRIALGSGLGCSLGAIFTILGTQWHMLAVIVMARFVFWTSLYGLMMVQTLLLYSFFQGPELTMAYSLLVFACRLGSVFGFIFSGPLLGRLGFLGAMWVSGALVVGSSATTLVFAFLFRGTITAQTVRPLLGGQRVEGKAFSLALVKAIPGSAYATILALGCLYGTVFPFEVVADDMLQLEFGFSPEQAGFLLTLVPAVALATPLMAPLLGRFATKKLISASVGFVLIGTAQSFIIAKWNGSLAVGFALMGTGYSISVCTLWTVLPQLVRANITPSVSVHEVEGTATGLGYALLSLCQFASNYAVGIIKDVLAYRHVSMWFIFVASLGLASAISSAILHVRNVRAHQPTELDRQSGDTDFSCECSGVRATSDERPGQASSGDLEGEEVDGAYLPKIFHSTSAGSLVENYCKN